MKRFRTGPWLLGVLLIAASVRANDSRQLKVWTQRTILAKADVQLHFPFLHEANNGIWYMTYREGRHGSNQEQVYCVTSADRGKNNRARAREIRDPTVPIRSQIDGSKSRPVLLSAVKTVENSVLMHRARVVVGQNVVR